MHVLLVEDDLDTCANIREFLESRRHTVDCARNGVRGLHMASGEGYDAVILDLGLPDIDGLAVCQRLRETSRRDVPILMLSGRSTEADKLRGFDAGADDYVTKPFSLLELLARLKALVHRASGTRVLQVDDLKFDLRTLLVQRGERPISLGPTGMRILEQLMRASPGVVTRRQLERTVWGEEPPGTDAALRGHILTIRSALDVGAQPKLLHTIHGIGYRLARSEASSGLAQTVQCGTSVKPLELRIGERVLEPEAVR
jgi:DNA-binding response OmpR family regulator